MPAATLLLQEHRLLPLTTTRLLLLAAAPAAVTVECIGDVPAMTSLTWTDNCDAGGSVAGVDGTTRWRRTAAEQSPGHGMFPMPAATLLLQEHRLLLLTTIHLPVLAAAPAAVTVECIGDVPAMASLTWTDNCDAGGSVAGVDGTLVGGNCGGTITRTWNVSDACGNPAIDKNTDYYCRRQYTSCIAAAPACCYR